MVNAQWSMVNALCIANRSSISHGVSKKQGCFLAAGADSGGHKINKEVLRSSEAATYKKGQPPALSCGQLQQIKY